MPLSWIARGAASAERGRRLMEQRGVTPNGHPLWQQWEVAPVVGMYPNYRFIFPLLLRRTKPAVYKKAGRLGITRPRGRPWSDPNELWRLRKVYPTGTKAEVLSAFPGRSYAAISKAANARGVYRIPPPPASTGILIIDQILARARLKRWTLKDLELAVRRQGYFSRKLWRRHQDFGADRRAVIALGGTVRARFR